VEGCPLQPLTVNCGVPHSSILGPLLFLLYINDLPGCLSFTEPHMYADDTNLSTAYMSTIEMQVKLNEDLININQWLLANRLSLNATKTKYMFIGSD
jgi:hypothetical protein